MPPRHTYWTIILEGKPTAFRAHTQEELLPTLRQLQSRHPDAVLMWFARGRLWKSEEESREALSRKRAPPDRRGPAWRPGGSHEDPRARFKVPRDEKRRRFRERLFRDNVPDDREAPVPERPPLAPARHDAPRPESGQRTWSRDRRPPREGGRPDRPAGQRPDRSGSPGARSGPSDRKPGWKPGRPAGPGGGERGWKPGRPGGQGGSPGGGWNPIGPLDQAAGVTARGSRIGPRGQLAPLGIAARSLDGHRESPATTGDGDQGDRRGNPWGRVDGAEAGRRVPAVARAAAEVRRDDLPRRPLQAQA